MFYKVCVIGTHGVGKTTLVNHVGRMLKQKGKPVVVAPELAQEMIQTFGFDWREASLPSIGHFQKFLYEYCMWVSGLENVSILQDRSVLDTCAYAKYKLGEDWLRKNKFQLKAVMSRYTRVYFYFIIDPTPEQARIQNELLKACAYLDIDFRLFVREQYDEVADELVDLFLKEDE